MVAVPQSSVRVAGLRTEIDDVLLHAEESTELLLGIGGAVYVIHHLFKRLLRLTRLPVQLHLIYTMTR
jgi:hypothetical protein